MDFSSTLEVQTQFAPLANLADAHTGALPFPLLSAHQLPHTSTASDLIFALYVLPLVSTTCQ
jgi:hypothetical protein